MQLPRFKVYELQARVLYYYALSKEKLTVQVSFRNLAKLWCLPTDASDTVRAVALRVAEEMPATAILRVNGVSATLFLQGSEEEQERAREVWEHWKMKVSPKTRALFQGARKSAVIARLRDGRTVEELKLAIDGLAASDFHMKGGHNDLELVCRNDVKLTSFLRRGEEFRRLSGMDSDAAARQEEVARAAAQDRERREALEEEFDGMPETERQELLDMAAESLDPGALRRMSPKGRAASLRATALRILEGREQ